MLAAALAVLAAAPATAVQAVEKPVEKAAWTQVHQGLGFASMGGAYPFQQTTIELPQGKIRLLISRGQSGVTREQLRAWVAQAGAQVAQYYGRFPVDLATVTILTGDEGDIGGGMAFGGRFVRVQVGATATQADLDEDWRMPHELLHLAFPEFDDHLTYLTEGLSTYLEPVIRAQTGQLSEEFAWGSMVLGFPNGLPTREDKGLDHTPSWGNTYWGGARFWLLVDLEIRLQSKGARSLQDLLRGVVAAGGNMSVEWSLEKLLTTAKEATGTDALRELHARMGSKRAPFDLEALWKKLGVKLKGRVVTFDDSAPLAAHRKAITAPVKPR
jgi:hypothetical protein